MRNPTGDISVKLNRLAGWPGFSPVTLGERSQRYSIYADLLKIIAILMVVLQHESVWYVKNLPVNSFSWWIANLLDSLSRFCVPVFVMASGAFLLDYTRNDTLEVFFRKRFKKVLIPFLSWAILYYFWFLYWKKNDFSFGSFIKEILKGWGTPNLPEHLWFLPLILGLYLATPVIKKFTDHASGVLLVYFLSLCFLFSSLIPMMEKFFEIKIGLNGTIFGGFVGYFVLGYVIHRASHFPKWSTIVTSILFISGIILTAHGTYFLNVRQGEFDHYFYTYTSPNVVLMSLAFFVLMRTAFAQYESRNMISPSYVKFTSFASSAVFGVYLIHIFILIWVGQLFAYWDVDMGVAQILILTTVASFLSFLLVVVLKNIPGIKYIVP